MPKVSIIKDGSRREGTRRSLELIAGEIQSAVGRRQVVIKPNFVSTSNQLASSHVEHVRGILDFLRGFYKGRVIIAEAACGDTAEGFRNFGFEGLRDEYRVELRDLNQGPFETVTLEAPSGGPLTVKAARMLLDPGNFRISAAKLKTHDLVVATLSIKNMAMGSVHDPDRQRVHPDTRTANLNIAALAGLAWPDLASLDGIEGMEGEGPTRGDPVHVGVTLASTDPLAADRVACEVMGVDLYKVGYLYYCAREGLGEADLGKIHIIGAELGRCTRPFSLHRNVRWQYQWR